MWKRKKQKQCMLRKAENDCDVQNRVTNFLLYLFLSCPVSDLPFFFCVCIVAHCHQSHDPHLHSHTSSSFRIFKVTLPMIETFICVLVLSVMAVEGQNEVKCDF